MKFLKLLLKEAVYFTALLFILAFLMHGSDLPKRMGMALDDPSKFGHALIYTALIFMIVFIFRAIFKVILMKINGRRDSKQL